MLQSFITKCHRKSLKSMTKCNYKVWQALKNARDVAKCCGHFKVRQVLQRVTGIT